jgi:hypothetical protein
MCGGSFQQIPGATGWNSSPNGIEGTGLSPRAPGRTACFPAGVALVFEDLKKPHREWHKRPRLPFPKKAREGERMS